MFKLLSPSQPLCLSSALNYFSNHTHDLQKIDYTNFFIANLLKYFLCEIINRYQNHIQMQPHKTSDPSLMFLLIDE